MLPASRAPPRSWFELLPGCRCRQRICHEAQHSFAKNSHSNPHKFSNSSTWAFVMELFLLRMSAAWTSAARRWAGKLLSSCSHFHAQPSQHGSQVPTTDLCAHTLSQTSQGLLIFTNFLDAFAMFLPGLEQKLLMSSPLLANCTVFQ